MTLTNTPEFTWTVVLNDKREHLVRADRLSISDMGTLIAFRHTVAGAPVVIYSLPCGEWTALSMLQPGTGLPMVGERA